MMLSHHTYHAIPPMATWMHMGGYDFAMAYEHSRIWLHATHLDSHDARNDGAVDTDPSASFHVAEVSLRVVEKLCHHEVSPGVHLGRNTRANTRKAVPGAENTENTKIKLRNSRHGARSEKRVTSTRRLPIIQ